MTFEIGLIFSTTGPYARLGRAALAGARHALADLAAEGTEVSVRAVDPAGIPENYERMTDAVLADGRVRHVVGAITSWSRKDMIPVLERHGAVLWYPCPYEGFEINDHVIYLGAAPNHHMVPLVERLAASGIRTAYLLGSNYVWGWETLRLARDLFGRHGIDVVGERYVPLGSDECGLALAEVERSEPDVVVNSLIGPSNAAFMSALGPVRPTVVSCNQTEADLDTIGPAGDGLISAGSFFEDLAPASYAAAAKEVSPNGRVSSFFATSYTAVRLIADAAAEAGTDDPRRVFEAVSARPRPSVLGPIEIDPVTRHASLTPHIAEARGGRFEVIHSAAAPVPADPYLSVLSSRPVGAAAPNLRIVQ